MILLKKLRLSAFVRAENRPEKPSKPLYNFSPILGGSAGKKDIRLLSLMAMGQGGHTERRLNMTPKEFKENVLDILAAKYKLLECA